MQRVAGKERDRDRERDRGREGQGERWGERDRERERQEERHGERKGEGETGRAILRDRGPFVYIRAGDYDIYAPVYASLFSRAKTGAKTRPK